MEDKEVWNDVEVPNVETESKVEYEIETEETMEQVADSAPSQEEGREEASQKAKEGEAPKELEGVETSGAQKRIRQLIRQRKERDEQIQSLIQKNEELETNLRTKSSEVQEINKLSLDASEKQLKDKLELAQAAYMEAFENGEKEKLLQAQIMLNDAQGDLKNVSSAKSNYEAASVEQPVQQQQVAPRPTATDPKAEQWASENEWFGNNNVMTAAALAIDAELKNEGYDPNDNEFYQEISNRMKQSFPQQFGEDVQRKQETSSKPAQVVSGGSRSPSSSSKKVKLSQEDIRLAQKWNIPLEKYAAEKLKVNGADGDYTTIK
tara:strand:- start:2663 stop:3625 length:963 start_codon:yes stop_codon:yes gene_type:complete